MGTLLSNIELEKVKINKKIAIRNIYYDFNKWDIRPDAARQLDNVVTLLKDNPTLSVELGSHTDARGNDFYNDTLSQKRADAAVQYIVDQGVPGTRIVAKGYGETQLNNRCSNGINCTEEQHQENRRTELRITGISSDGLEKLQWQSLEDIIKAEEAAKSKKPKLTPINKH
jgi:outer membrane protein OmpA-like peptidoglycan-associated protein